ncbi:MAG: ribosome maturation factor RimM [Proteobacteria bacterium]|nr:ribosome maturation factor RimM [Pseudomonadota bacterium]
MTQNKNILIGKITSAHGIKGCVNIMSFTEIAEDIFNYSNIFDKNGKKLIIKAIGEAKGKNHDVFIAKIKDVNDRNTAESLRNKELFINRDSLPQTSDNEFYYSDVIGLKVLDINGQLIGKVTSIDDFGAGGIIEVQFENNSEDGKPVKELFSFNDQTVPEVNIAQGYLTLDIPDLEEVKEE